MLLTQKQKYVDKNNSKENSLKIYHDYHVDDKVLITSIHIQRKLNVQAKVLSLIF